MTHEMAAAHTLQAHQLSHRDPVPRLINCSSVAHGKDMSNQRPGRPPTILMDILPTTANWRDGRRTVWQNLINSPTRRSSMVDAGDHDAHHDQQNPAGTAERCSLKIDSTRNGVTACDRPQHALESVPEQQAWREGARITLGRELILKPAKVRGKSWRRRWTSEIWRRRTMLNGAQAHRRSRWAFFRRHHHFTMLRLDS